MTKLQLSLTPLESAMEWIANLREELRPRGRSLDPLEHHSLQPFAETNVLHGIRVVEMDDLTEINDSVFDSYFSKSVRPIELNKIVGLTLVDTICLARNRIDNDAHRLAILFQETVHVYQFKQFGVRGFVHAYLEGWEKNGQSHEDIPLERKAALLRARFERNKSDHFSIERELIDEISM